MPVVVVGAGAVAVSAVGFLDGRFWFAELATSIRMHVFLAAVVLLAVALAARSALGACLALVALVVNALVLAPLYTADPADPADSARFEIAHVNMQRDSGDLDALERTLAERRPDVMVVFEPPPEWSRRFDELEYRVVSRREFGEPTVLVLSIAGVRDVAVPTLLQLPDASIAFDVELGRLAVRVFALHVQAPTSAGTKDARDAQLATVEAWTRGHRGPEIVLGDLNTTPWSSAAEELEAANDLRNSAEGFGIQATWPAFAGPLGIPIDQLLHSRELTVVERGTGPGFGSEHRSLWVTVARAAPS